MRSWLALSAAALLLSGCAAFDLFGGGEVPEKPPVLDPDLVQRGAALFADPRLSGDSTRSCASCHPGGGADHGVYQAGEAVAPGTPGGRRTISLRGLWQTAPYYWDGSAPTLAAALERMLAVEMRGGRLEGRDRAALEAYLRSIPAFDRGRLKPDGAPVEPAKLSARKGFAVFVDSGCDVCHRAPAFTNRSVFDVGTGGEFAVPTLRGVSAGGPWGHDGRWPDLESAVRAIARAREIELSSDQMGQLLEYLALL